MRKTSRSKGFILPGALLLIIVVLLLAMTRLYFSREQLNQVNRISDYERSYQAAAGGIDVSKKALDDAVKFINDGDPATFPKTKKAPEHLKYIVGGLLDDDGGLRQGAEFELDTPLLEYIRREFREVGFINAYVTLSGGKPIYLESRNLEVFSAAAGAAVPDGACQRADGREANYVLSLNVKSKVGDSKCSVTAFIELRNVNVTPSVIGKFVLFAKKKNSLKINVLTDSTNPANFKVTPVLVKNQGSASEQMPPVKLRDLLDAQGWIFMGGDAQWSFNATYGGGGKDFQDAPLRTDLYHYAIDDGTLSTSPSLNYYAAMKGIHSELFDAPGGDSLKLHPDAGARLNSALNLFGSASCVTPTVVIGRVTRSFALLQGFYNSSVRKYAPLPYQTEASFNSASWPGNMSSSTVDAIKKHFSNDFKKYALRMCDIISEDYNSANLLLADFGKAGEKTFLIDPDTVSVVFPDFPDLSRMKVNSMPAKFYKAIVGPAYTLLDDRGRILFNGDDFSRFYEPGFILHKVGYQYKNFQDFSKKSVDAEKKAMRVSGIIKIGEGLETDQPIKIAPGGGGIIIVDGDIVFRRGVYCPASEPLTFVSLSGNISVATAEPVKAALIALSGRVSLPSSFNIDGLLAAREFFLEDGQQRCSRALTYNRIFDPTDFKNYSRNYKLMVREDWQNYVE